MSNTSPKTAKKWTCAECGVTVSRADGERVALPDAWTQTGEGTFCLLCRRERVARDTSPWPYPGPMVGPRESLGVLRERNYRRLFLGRTISLVGDGIAPVA